MELEKAFLNLEMLPVSSQREEDERAFQTVIKANTKALRQACHSQKDSVVGEHWAGRGEGKEQVRSKQMPDHKGLLHCADGSGF